MKSYFDAMRRYAVFRGRSTRSQYWLFFLVVTALIVVAAVIDSAMTEGTVGALPGEDFGGAITGLVLFVHLLPFWALTVRRLHDAGLSGWWAIACIIPLVALIMALLPSSPKGARYDDLVPATAMAPAPAMPPATPQGQVEQLERLAALRGSGAIDEDEYRQMKADVVRKAAR